MRNGRKRFTAGLATAAVLGIAFVPSSAQAEPDIDDVRTQVEELYHSAEQASERRNDAHIELERLEGELSVLQADEAAQSEGFESVRGQVADAVVSQSQGASVAPVTEAVLSGNTQDFLSELSTLSTYNDVQGRIVSTYTTELASLQIRREATQERVDRIAEVEAQAQAESDAIDEQVAEAEALLATLEAEEAATVLASEGTSDPVEAAEVAETATSNAAVSGSVSAVLDYALAQVGKSYVYGASGPNSFDCSGLTSMAWAQAGVSLPRSSKAQYSAGTKVSRSELQPGDLVFYYSPISHVGIYIGDGQIVHAANPRTGVEVTSVGSMPYSGAVRPG
ncbi:NlpC/P60 family protein [Nocardioides zeae]|uniref:NlpC/P60 family protein n=1 Tax=Nocardioides imazamoxiresistens TaxID=3231893 RepID=A0ABU3PX36_9ACTN|nr:NlpC/P60 family protein [Nocardioides zeae]MDT9593795.1 NlpC/P60 family protein [Nocardioides zeae]